VLSTAKASRLLGFRAARDTRAAFEEYISQRRVLRYTPDNQGYQYEKELEDFIHSRAPASEDGESDEELVEVTTVPRTPSRDFVAGAPADEAPYRVGRVAGRRSTTKARPHPHQ
jgi:hypothetical protein